MKRGELALCVFGLFAFYTAFPFGPPARMVSYTPPVPEENPVGTLFDLWTPEEADALMNAVRSKSPYATFVGDVTSTVEHVGEAQLALSDGTCAHPYLIASKSNASLCVLPSRIDIARHFLLSGGWGNHREGYERLVSRMRGFNRMFFTPQADGSGALKGNYVPVPEVETLFETPRYKQAATEACNGRAVFDPMQLGVIIQVPGQEVPLHYDVPWFYRATRFSLPQWLLIAMDRSGLWEDLRVPQIQGVAYLHQWGDNETAAQAGGAFFYYPDGPRFEPKVFDPVFNSAIVVDGSIVIHGTTTYTRVPGGGRDFPTLDKDTKYELRHLEGDQWQVWAVADASKGETDDALIHSYTTNDLRISLVWRQRCFKTVADREAWHAQTAENDLKPEEVIDRFRVDLDARGVLPIDQEIDMLDLAMLLMDEYVSYPFNADRTLFTRFNYCMIPKAAPVLAPLFALFC